MHTTQVGRIPWSRESEPAVLTTVWSVLMADAQSAIDWLRRAYCGLGGHAMMLQFAPGRLSLRCHSCGEQTPGWSIGVK